MNNVILPNVTLAAIVRDEKINPAGGIEDFLDCTMPFVGAGVIVDTGSLDGTRDILEKMKRKYTKMNVYDQAFTDYASSRNYSLSQVQTPFALVLDADERLSQEDFEKLRKAILDYPMAMGFNFEIEDIDFYCAEVCRALHNPRLFVSNTHMRYKNYKPKSGEFLYFDEHLTEDWCIETGVRIKHFRPRISGQEIKQSWRQSLNYQEGFNVALSQFPGFELVKEISPMRARYKFGILEKPKKKKARRKENE